ncbi:hypothetical protein [Micromonospora coriariae]|uniref:hypothetical protein n=1 Tax=Micromonospora coriariae TaxID=285665 RepID=UPI000B5AE3DA|nr:hypothetical protein [Micromonospora coriariae]
MLVAQPWRFDVSPCEAGDPDTTLFVYTTEAGSPSRRAMDLLASWTAPDSGLNREQQSRRHPDSATG